MDKGSPITAGPISYPLTATVQYMRRPKASTVLMAMAKRAWRLEERGATIEFFQGYLSGDGDYLAIYGVDEPASPAEQEVPEEAA